VGTVDRKTPMQAAKPWL